MMRLPVRVLSDLHLAHRASRIRDAKSLRPLFAGIGTVIFNGDTWQAFVGECREKSAKMLEELKRVVAEEGCDAIFLRGNHDPEWDGKPWVSLADGRVVVTHGDALLRASSPWKREILNRENDVESVWAAHPKAEWDLNERLEVSRELARFLPSLRISGKRSLYSRVVDAAFPPKRALLMIHAWLFQANLGAEFCERYLPGAEILVIGHFHCAACRVVRGKTVINTGSFVVPGPARYVDWDGEMLRYGDITEKSGAFLIGPAKRTWRLL